MSLSFSTTSMSACDDAGVVERLERHAGAHRAVADDGDALAALALQARRDRHAERGRDRGRRMRGAEGVVLALVAARKAGDAAELAQRRHALRAAGEHLVRIGLVADVPDQPVVRRVEDVVQRDRRARPCRGSTTVAAGLRHALHDELAQLGARARLSSARDRRRTSAGAVDLVEQLGHGAGRDLHLSFARDDAVGELAQLLGVGRCRCRRARRGPRRAAPRRAAWAASRPSTVT